MCIRDSPSTRERERPEENMRLVSAYLAQIELPTRPPAFKESDRAHDEESASTGVLYTLKAGTIQDVLAYLTTIQDVEH